MSDIRTAAGISALMSAVIIIVTGFIATSSRDLGLVIFGFAMGLVAVYLLERFRRPVRRPAVYREFRIPARPEAVWHLDAAQAPTAAEQSAHQA